MKIRLNNRLAAVTIAAFFASSVMADEGKKGDINGDGLVNNDDVAMVACHLLGVQNLTEVELQRADCVGEDNKVTVGDLIWILNNKDQEVLPSGEGEGPNVAEARKRQ